MDPHKSSQQIGGGSRRRTIFPRIVVAVDNDSGETDRREGKRPVRERIVDWLLALIIASILVLGWNAYDFRDRLSTLTTNLAILTEKYIR